MRHFDSSRRRGCKIFTKRCEDKLSGHTSACKMVYLAPGVRLIRRCHPSESFYRGLAFATTYLTYIAYHIAKRPIAVVESSVNFLDCSENETALFRNDGPECTSWVNEMNGEKEKSEEIISNMQVFYAAFYAGFMFLNGMIAEWYIEPCFIHFSIH